MNAETREAVAAELDTEAEWQEAYVGTALLVLAKIGDHGWDSYQQTIGTVNHARETVERLRTRTAELRGEAHVDPPEATP